MRFLKKCLKCFLWGAACGAFFGGVIAFLSIPLNNTTEEEVNIRISVNQNQLIMVNPAADIKFGSCGNKFTLALSGGGQLIPEYVPTAQIPVAVDGPCWQKTLSHFEGQILVTKGPVVMVIENASEPIWVHVYYTSHSFWMVYLKWFLWITGILTLIFILMTSIDI